MAQVTPHEWTGVADLFRAEKILNKSANPVYFLSAGLLPDAAAFTAATSTLNIDLLPNAFHPTRYRANLPATKLTRGGLDVRRSKFAKIGRAHV